MDRREFLTGAVAGGGAHRLRRGRPRRRAAETRRAEEGPNEGRPSGSFLRRRPEGPFRPRRAAHLQRLPSRKLDDEWSVDALSKLRDRVEKAGIALDMVPLPMSSSLVTGAENPNIVLGKSPERDREIDAICQMIRNTGKAGIPAVKYNLTLLGVVRTGLVARPRRRELPELRLRQAQGRRRRLDGGRRRTRRCGSGSRISSSAWCRSRRSTRCGCAATRTTPACRPARAIAASTACSAPSRASSSFVEIVPSPYHGLNFCQGTVAEMLDEPRQGDLRRHPLVRQGAARSSTSTFATSGAASSSFRRRSPTTATWTCCGRCASTRRWATTA